MLAKQCIVICLHADSCGCTSRGSPLDDPPQTQRFVMALAVGTRLVATVDQLVQRLDLSLVHVVLFHYDGISGMRAWEAAPWHEQAVHICALRQTKWWFAKRFLTPPLVGRYELIFVWDEDLGVDFGFDFNRLVDVVRAHDLQISQPSVVGPVSWPITRRVPSSEVHKHSALKYNSEPCEAADMGKPPCGAMVEVQAPVFTAVAWNCVWAMLQNDLVHAFGIDMAWHVCAAVGNRSAADAMGIIDASPVEHLRIPSLAQQGRSVGEEPPWVSINQRRDLEWAVWNARWEAALRLAPLKLNDP